ncbi:hypothetical protein MAA_00009 [Metarhizium robertsii ARSEF 23]|uniref:Uncharacterized protein n=1 Tax=Metarhizium robertsii (strain ARSEF 23 / ATCC MYA-3075) TaxID=655844 RepID=E9EJ10_METRA|nr:uncharacterized protein MAA_00009 [Metarhizium robertsii ARSEF 23]EFZ02935.1 hypothetical protein MAA_00009 [Metarhizium robertsii ARSEF 23]
MLRKRVIALLTLLLGRVILADRPNDQSICDYYASQRYGASNSTTQLRLMQGIVAYAYAGGNTLPNPATNSTGIFNPGQFNGYNVYLRPWFDGSKATTNLNNQAVGVNWLDGGGTEPLIAFLNGSTKSADIKNGTNQYCSQYKTFLDSSFTPLTPAYVHRFMDLNQTEVGYFIEQLIAASKYYGFSDTDATTLSTFMNARYNIRCAPPANGELYSICLANECPLAAPDANCDAYNNIQPYGLTNVTTQSSTPTPVLPTTSTASSTSSTATSTTAAPTAPAGGSSSLSGGAIAGIAIGAAAASLLTAGMWLFFRRKRRAKAETPLTAEVSDARFSSGFAPQSAYGPNRHGSYSSHSPYVFAASTTDSHPPTAVEWSPPQELDAENPPRVPMYYTKYAQ